MCLPSLFQQILKKKTSIVDVKITHRVVLPAQGLTGAMALAELKSVLQPVSL
jgi:hypothetical protein